MKNPTHILICGEIGSGKSTMIRRLTAEVSRPVYGFVTKKMPPDENGYHPVHISSAQPQSQTYKSDHLVGLCQGVGLFSVYSEVFDTIGLKLLKAPSNGVIIMDELGFMESQSDLFCKKVLETLDQNIPVIAAVKTKDIPFLKAVRAHKNAVLYTLTVENRDVLYKELSQIVLKWNGSSFI